MWVLRNILHDWSDADCQRILSAIRAAVGATPITLTLVEVCTHQLRVLACGMPQVAAARPGGFAGTWVRSLYVLGQHGHGWRNDWDACLLSRAGVQLLRVCPPAAALRPAPACMINRCCLHPAAHGNCASPHIANQLPSCLLHVATTLRSAL